MYLFVPQIKLELYNVYQPYRYSQTSPSRTSIYRIPLIFWSKLKFSASLYIYFNLDISNHFISRFHRVRHKVFWLYTQMESRIEIFIYLIIQHITSIIFIFSVNYIFIYFIYKIKFCSSFKELLYQQGLLVSNFAFEIIYNPELTLIIR